MKSFFLAVVFSLLLLNIIHNDVSGKLLLCYATFGADGQLYCRGDNPLCFTVVMKENQSDVTMKSCVNEKENLDSECNNRAPWETCKEPCDTELCNNEPYNQPPVYYSF